MGRTLSKICTCLFYFELVIFDGQTLEILVKFFQILRSELGLRNLRPGRLEIPEEMKKSNLRIFPEMSENAKPGLTESSAP